MNPFERFINTVTDQDFLVTFFNSMADIFGWLFTSFKIGNVEISVFSVLFGAGIILYLGYAVAKFLIPS